MSKRAAARAVGLTAKVAEKVRIGRRAQTDTVQMQENVPLIRVHLTPAMRRVLQYTFFSVIFFYLALRYVQQIR